MYSYNTFSSLLQISVQVCHKITCELSIFCIYSVSAFSGPVKSSFLDDLQKNKKGIHVSSETDFGRVEMGGRKSLTVWVQNKGEATPVFLRAHLPAECTQIKIEGI